MPAEESGAMMGTVSLWSCIGPVAPLSPCEKRLFCGPVKGPGRSGRRPLVQPSDRFEGGTSRCEARGFAPIAKGHRNPTEIDDETDIDHSRF